MKKLRNIHDILNGSQALAHRITLILIFIALASSFTLAQYQPVFITGMITEENTGMPFPHKRIQIESDTSSSTPLFYINQEAFSNEEGFYTFTVNADNHEIHLWVYVIDCNGVRHDTSLAIYASELAPSHYTVNFTICKKLYVDCVPDFRVELIDSYEGHHRYKFYDLSESNIVSWKWNFGDGDSSLLQNPVHDYTETGLFDVSLTISNSLFPNMGCVDSITKMLNVGNLNYWNFGGHIFSDAFPIDLGFAFLYRYDSTGLVAVDTAVCDTLGFYYFYQVPEGDYIVLAGPKPGSSSYYHYMPTYFGDEMYWKDATIIHLDTTGWEYDIHLIKLAELNQGAGSISGGTFLVDSLHTILNPAEDIQVLLLDEDEQPVSCTYSNGFGDFFFTELPYGTYSIYAEVTGASVYPYIVTINEDNPNISNLIIEIMFKEVHYSIDELASDYLELANTIYPNPGTHLAYLDINIKQPASFHISIFNQVGHCVQVLHHSAPTGLHTIPIDICSLQNGIYFFRIDTQDGYSFVEKLIKF